MQIGIIPWNSSGSSSSRSNSVALPIPFEETLGLGPDRRGERKGSVQYSSPAMFNIVIYSDNMQLVMNYNLDFSQTNWSHWKNNMEIDYHSNNNHSGLGLNLFISSFLFAVQT